MRHIRSQAAMEYLMTYGWAIIIIAVVLITLFQLGVFSAVNLTPRAQPGNCKIIRVAGQANPEGVCQGELPEFVGQFNGQSSKVATSAVAINNQFTISLWMNGNVPASLTYPIVVSNPGANPFEIYYVNAPPIYLVFKYHDNVGEVHDGSPETQISTGTWLFATLTFNNGVGTWYINGQKTVQTTNNAMPSDTNTLGIGNYPGGGGYVFNGLISNFQIYNTTLDANQISALYLEGIGGAPIDPYHIVGWWPLNGNPTDYSGNGNSGTPTNVIFNSQWMSGYIQP